MVYGSTFVAPTALSTYIRNLIQWINIYSEPSMCQVLGKEHAVLNSELVD